MKNTVKLSLFGVAVLAVASVVTSSNLNKSYENQEVLIPSPAPNVPIVGTRTELNKLAKVESETKTVKTLKVPANRTVLINGPIGYVEESDNEIKAKLKELGSSKEPIFVLINSPGGSVDVGNEIVSLMQAADGPVYTVCTALCASMAAVILEHGTKRFALDRATVMFHDASGGARGSLGQMNSILQFYRRGIEKTNRYIAARSSMKYEEFMELQKDNLWIDAEDAKSLNLVDDLVRLK